VTPALVVTGIPLLLFAVCGVVLGSFGNVLLHRLPTDSSLGGRSRCPHCSHPLGIRDLVPVLSYLWLRGKCRFCQARISLRYPVVEIASGFLFLAALVHTDGQMLPGALLGIALWLFFLIAIIDGTTGLIPDALSIPLILVSAAFGFAVGRVELGAIILGVAWFSVQWLLSRGRWVGSGDILLGAAIGFLAGSWHRVLLSLGLSYVLGAAFALALLLRGKRTGKDRMSFGPFLAAGTTLAVFFGDQILGLLLGY